MDLDKNEKMYRNLALLRTDLIQYFDKNKNRQTLPDIFVRAEADKWSVSGEDLKVIVEDLGWQMSDERLKRIPVQVFDETKPSLTMKSPTYIKIDKIPSPSNKSTNFNADGEAVNKER